MKKLLAVFLSLLLGGVGSFSCLAFVPYDSYTYSTQTGEAVAQFCPTPYYPAFTIDKATIGVPLVTPTCMCFDKEGNLYITCLLYTSKHRGKTPCKFRLNLH